MKTDRHLSHGPSHPYHNGGPSARFRNWLIAGILLVLAFLIVGIVACAYFFVPWWVESQTEHYIPYNNQALIGTIKNAETGTNNTAQLLLSTPVDSGTMRTDPSYLLHCKVWRLHADILTTPSWINTPSHSWYQLTFIEGSQCRDQHGNVIPSIDKKIIGSNDAFGANVLQGEGFGLVSAKEVTSNFMSVDGKTYRVSVTQTALLLTALH